MCHCCVSPRRLAHACTVHDRVKPMFRQAPGGSVAQSTAKTLSATNKSPAKKTTFQFMVAILGNGERRLIRTILVSGVRIIRKMLMAMKITLKKTSSGSRSLSWKMAASDRIWFFNHFAAETVEKSRRTPTTTWYLNASSSEMSNTAKIFKHSNLP